MYNTGWCCGGASERKVEEGGEAGRAEAEKGGRNGGIFRRVRPDYHEVVNSAPTFPREIIIFPLVKSEPVTLMRAYIRREK